MEDRLQHLETQVEGLVEGLAQLEDRLSALETSEALAPTLTESTLAESEPAPPETEIAALPLDEKSLSNVATSLGRILLIFGGAYFLRALTDFEVLPAGAGVFLGALYTLVWLVMAYLAGGKQLQRTTAILYGIASTLMALPLLVEATTRFQLLSGGQGALVLTVFFLLAMTVAVIRDLRSLGWLATIGSMVTALVLLRMTHAAGPYAVSLLIIGLASLWAVYLRGWKGLHWFGAIGADLGIVIVALLSFNERWTLSPTAVYALAISLLLLFLLSFAVRSHLNKKTVGWFETVQAMFVIAETYWAVFRVVAAEHLNLTLLGAA